jgi:small subunit ribosomal protein S17
MTTQNTVVRTLTGTVVSDKRAKTRKVQVNWAVRHPQYRKVVRKKTNFQVHDPENSSHIGDIVLIQQCRPVSKTKSWELVSIIQVSNIV